jgi:hypothetical protein
MVSETDDVVTGVLVPAGIVIPPMLAGLCMAFSSVSVVLSSIDLKRYKKPVIPLEGMFSCACVRLVMLLTKETMNEEKPDDPSGADWVPLKGVKIEQASLLRNEYGDVKEV